MLHKILSAIFENSGRVWGDGFVDDDFSVLSSIRSWDDLDSDQYVRFYGRLAVGDDPVAGSIVTHLSRRVDFLSADPASVSPVQLAFLRDVLRRVREGIVGPAPGEAICLFAFLTGIHPAYVWSDAFPTHERDTAAGWLGVLASRRPAFMPIEVADYLMDVIDVQAGRIALRDPAIAALIVGKVDLHDLKICARDRQDNVMRIMRPAPLIDRNPRGAAIFPALPRWRTAKPSIVSDR